MGERGREGLWVGMCVGRGYRWDDDAALAWDDRLSSPQVAKAEYLYLYIAMYNTVTVHIKLYINMSIHCNIYFHSQIQTWQRRRVACCLLIHCIGGGNLLNCRCKDSSSLT